MARIRTIKPDFWSDGKVVRLSPAARLLFIGSWNFALCDDGHLPDDVMGLKFKVLPADDVDAVALLDELLAEEIMVRGETSDGRSYLHVPRLRDHQKVDNRWTPRCYVCASQKLAEAPATSPELPETRASLGETHRNSPELPAVKEGKVKDKNSSDESDTIDLFDEFWKNYPRKEAKAAARKAWDKVTQKIEPQEIIDGLTAYSFSPDPKFRPLPASWINGQRWEDEASVHQLHPAAGGRRQQVLVGDRWRDVSGDEVTIGRTVRWVQA